jgi:hypothetical protein
MLDVLVDLKIVSTSGLHPQGDVLSELIVRNQWCGFKDSVW